MISTLLGWALGLLKLISRIARGIFDWVTSDWRHAAIAMLGAICAAQLIWIEPALRDRIADRTAERDTARQERDDERAAHRQTKTDYREAQAEAARQEQKRIERVKAEQQEITDAVEADYRRQLAGLHARAERLREELRAGTGAAGAGGSIAVSGLSTATGRTAEAAGDRGFPAAFGRSPAEQLERDVIATGQAIQLNALIDWLLAQAAIDPNAAEPQ
jgi:hypothetical protein